MPRENYLPNQGRYLSQNFIPGILNIIYKVIAACRLWSGETFKFGINVYGKAVF